MREQYAFSVQGNPKMRLDRYLLEHLPKHFSRSRLHRLFEEGKVWVDGKNVKPHHHLKEGQKVELLDAIPLSPHLSPEPIPLNIVFEDSYLLVVDKPPGMVVHPAVGNWSGTLVNALLYHTEHLSTVNGPSRAGIVHRLDKDTSGLLVCAKDDAVHRDLAEQFAKREARRSYVALVMGIVQFDEGVIDLPLGRSPSDRKKFAVRYVAGKEALTRYEVVERFKDFTLLKLRLETGRTHQIRVHLAHLGHPVVGDRLYGGGAAFPRQALHAATLTFRHPVSGKPCVHESPVPADMKQLIEKGFLR